MANHYPLNLANDTLLSEIAKKKAFLYSLYPNAETPFSKTKEQLQGEAGKHSVEIELAGIGRSEARKLRRKNHKNLLNALEWGLQHYKGYVTEDFIGELGLRIEPEINRAGYRTGTVYLQTLRGPVEAVAPEKSGEEINYFLFENSCLESVVDKAIHAHFHIARIHPFGDGNGRTARLAQNIILEKESFFPIVIKKDEREKYVDMIAAAAVSYRKRLTETNTESNPFYVELHALLAASEIYMGDINRCKYLCLALSKKRMTRQMSTFYNYLAEKVNAALDHEIKKAQQRIEVRKGNDHQKNRKNSVQH